jgi:CHAT domain-containing protein
VLLRASGSISFIPGDDLFGLQRAFLQSGARTVVAGLWDVYDGKAPELMNGVFQRLVKGESTAEALTGSQREFIKKYRDLPEPRRYFTHPYFWAVYSVWGDDRTTVKP